MSARFPAVTDAEGAYFLELFRADMVNKLVAEGVAAVRPAIERAAREAVAELEPQIRAQYDFSSTDLVVQLSVRGPR